MSAQGDVSHSARSTACDGILKGGSYCTVNGWFGRPWITLTDMKHDGIQEGSGASHSPGMGFMDFVSSFQVPIHLFLQVLWYPQIELSLLATVPFRI